MGAREQGVEFIARDAFGHGHAIAPRRIDAMQGAKPHPKARLCFEKRVRFPP